MEGQAQAAAVLFKQSCETRSLLAFSARLYGLHQVDPTLCVALCDAVGGCESKDVTYNPALHAAWQASAAGGVLRLNLGQA